MCFLSMKMCTHENKSTVMLFYNTLIYLYSLVIFTNFCWQETRPILFPDGEWWSWETSSLCSTCQRSTKVCYVPPLHGTIVCSFVGYINIHFTYVYSSGTNSHVLYKHSVQNLKYELKVWCKTMRHQPNSIK